MITRIFYIGVPVRATYILLDVWIYILTLIRVYGITYNKQL